MSNKPRKVIFDTDPGVDDAMALYFALAHPGIDVVGLTTTFGNVTVEQAAINGLYLTEIAGFHIPVTQGVKTPWLKAPGEPPAFIHGADGLGNLPSRVPTQSKLDPRPSAQFIVDMARAHPGEITLVAVGPLGNLATALKLEPQLPQLLQEVIIMGGTVLEPGNVSPVAEANIWNDPHSADFVFTAGWKLTMVGLDVTHQLVLPSAIFKKLAEHHRHIATDTLLHAVNFYSDFYSGLYSHVAREHGCFGHDVLAFVALTNPELFQTQDGRIRVALDGAGNGQTMMRRRAIPYPQAGWGDDVPDTTVCLQVQADAARTLIESTLMLPWLKK
ncbi:nucleoside hydrolase [Curvibacter sp. CHRR-16]|uniref:nucleoside hydrolase n=1 Tax=Curvibacter sp. CHRR-16 TaxID=2835872 RepID=UPI001BDB20CA|nr:nucleoside hydrolase [Curvibacter sp. CHRR-16]MBT0571026.1 nucleoside hydrolase [Curvibacter sp. CHRR-16]